MANFATKFGQWVFEDMQPSKIWRFTDTDDKVDIGINGGQSWFCRYLAVEFRDMRFYDTASGKLLKESEVRWDGKHFAVNKVPGTTMESVIKSLKDRKNEAKEEVMLVLNPRSVRLDINDKGFNLTFLATWIPTPEEDTLSAEFAKKMNLSDAA